MKTAMDAKIPCAKFLRQLKRIALPDRENCFILHWRQVSFGELAANPQKDAPTATRARPFSFCDSKDSRIRARKEIDDWEGTPNSYNGRPVASACRCNNRAYTMGHADAIVAFGECRTKPQQIAISLLAEHVQRPLALLFRHSRK